MATTTSNELRRARAFAQVAHGTQPYGAEDYVVHLDAVVEVLREFDRHEDTALLIAGYLHDTLEDTTTTLTRLILEFGPDVAMLVYAVTDEPGATRRERKAFTLKKTRAVGPRAVMLKYADRIANVRSAQKNRSDLFEMYQHEHPSFVAAFADVPGTTKMRLALELLLS